jgi:hypothetical protein
VISRSLGLFLAHWVAFARSPMMNGDGRIKCLPFGNKLFLRVQVMFGMGLPVAEHSRRTGEPFRTCRWPPDVTWIFGGSGIRGMSAYLHIQTNVMCAASQQNANVENQQKREPRHVGLNLAKLSPNPSVKVRDIFIQAPILRVIIYSIYSFYLVCVCFFFCSSHRPSEPSVRGTKKQCPLFIS